MKKILMLLAMVSFAGVAHADSVNRQPNANHFLGQRAFAAKPVAKADVYADTAWEGTGMVTDQIPGEDGVQEKSKQHPQQMRLHFLGKRPFGDMHVAE